MDGQAEQVLQSVTKDRMSVVQNGADAKFPDNKCIHHLFQEQVVRTPGKVAVVGGGQSITYEELDKQSNRLGRYLQSKGVKPETPVGICLDRSINMIIGIISILKAGGAYVPIDPDYPEDRISFMIEDSTSRILVTQTSLRSKLPDTNAEIVCIDEIAEELQRELSTPLHSDVKPHNLAYVIYTSGSTGRPKGVMIENRNVVRLLFNDQFQFDFNEHDAWSIFHSFCFDFSVWELYGALLLGGKAVIVPKEATRDPHAFIDIILREKVTVINQTPSAFYSLMPYLIKISDQASFLRYVIFGGEKLNPGKLREIRYTFPQVAFVNMYGITETTVHVTYKEITEKEITEGVSNIGKPIPTLKVYIFDKNMQLVPMGVKGELCISGHGVARGYLNREELTKEKFISNPLYPEERLYRSGDLGRMRENGELEYFGRMDKQIQLRGFRIELGEIETVIAGLKEIKDCVVAAEEALNGDNRIIAYIIPVKNGVSIDNIKHMIGKKLPEYMIPSFFIQVQEFPLTDNGKLDLKKLPPADYNQLSEVNHSAPQNATERIMLEIWSEVLCIEKNMLGREYSFFEIGGHSLSAMVLLGRIREKFKKEVSIRHIYENPKLNDLCLVIQKLGDIKEQTASTGKDAIPPDKIYPVSSTQLAFWLTTYLFKLQTSNVCEVYRLDGVFDFTSFKAALNRVSEFHDSLWYRFSEKRPSFNIAEPVEFDIECIDWNELCANQEQHHLDDLIIEILHKPFDLIQVPLFRMVVIKQKTEKHILLVSFPHIICDIVSVNAFIRDVFDAYVRSAKTNRPPIQLRKTSAKDIIGYEIEYIKSTDFVKDREFWLNTLEGTELLKVNRKYFFPRLRRKSPSRKLLTKIKLEDSVIRALHKLSDRSNASTQIIILAIVQATLHTLIKQKDISTRMVYDMSGMHPYPPAVQLSATMVTVVSEFTSDTSYESLISNLKAFIVEALCHVRLPGSILTCIPVSSALKHRPWLSKILKTISRFYAWYYRKSRVDKDIIATYMFYVLGMVALGLKNFGRRKNNRTRHPSVIFNVLPSFYDPKKIWSNEQLNVTSIGDREWVMNPSVFEEKNKFSDANALNIDLLRDNHDVAYLYLWGGNFNPYAFACMEKAIHYHLIAMLENPASQILPEAVELPDNDSY